MKYTILLLCLVLSACTAGYVKKSVKKIEGSGQGFTGFALYDPLKEEMIYAQNEDRYFVPASNTKLLTFYTAWKVLGDSIAGLNYTTKGDSLIFWGTGDPSFLHPDLKNTKAYDFLAKADQKLFYANNFPRVIPHGPGWSWEWYKFYYATERSPFPVYGNVVRFQKELKDSLFAFSPAYFQENIQEDSALDTGKYRMALSREKSSNAYSYLFDTYDSLKFKIDIPFITSGALMADLLQDTLKRPVQLLDYEVVRNVPHLSLYTTTPDSIYKRMLQNSDNFLAEQLLLLSSDKLFDSLSPEAAIDYAKEHFLSDLPDEPHWVDGSGLSGQNLFTPRSMVRLLEKIRKEVPEEKLFLLLPAGGQSGTIKNWFKAEEPYVFAKTGTLSNSVCLSGYLITQSGKTLLFSFMNNNYSLSAKELKEEMEGVLYQVHKRY